MLESLASKSSGVKVCKVDINRKGVEGIDFESPVAQQYTQGGVPYFVVYDDKGNAQTGDAAFQTLVQLCMKAGMTGDWLRQQGVIR